MGKPSNWVSVYTPERPYVFENPLTYVQTHESSTKAKETLDFKPSYQEINPTPETYDYYKPDPMDFPRNFLVEGTSVTGQLNAPSFNGGLIEVGGGNSSSGNCKACKPNKNILYGLAIMFFIGILW